MSSSAGLPLKDLDWLDKWPKQEPCEIEQNQMQSLACGKEEHLAGCGAAVLKRP